MVLPMTSAARILVEHVRQYRLLESLKELGLDVTKRDHEDLRWVDFLHAHHLTIESRTTFIPQKATDREIPGLCASKNGLSTFRRLACPRPRQVRLRLPLRRLALHHRRQQ